MLFRLVQLYSRLPLPWVRALGRRLGWLIYWMDKRYRSRIDENLAIARQTDPKIKAAAISGIGAGLAEAPWVWGYTPGQLREMIVCDQSELLESLSTEGRPVLFLTPHLGSFEMTARFLAAWLRITVLYKEPQSAKLRHFMARIRNTENLVATPASLKGVRAMLQALKAGHAVGILPDQVPSGGEGRWIPFFGRHAYTMTLPQRLAESSGARVVIVVGTPLDGPDSKGLQGVHWRFHLEEMLEPATPENINLRFEEIIQTMPHLYLWGYNRYKRPPGAVPAPDEADFLPGHISVNQTDASTGSGHA